MVIHADKIRWLFWLRWKTFLRSFTRGAGRWSRIVGVILLLLFGVPFIGGIAVLTFFAYRYLPSPANAEILFIVLTGIYILWMLLPLLEYTVNEGLDISKLTLFPLTRAELMVSLVLSSLLDIPTLGLLLIFAAVVVGWSFSLPLTLFALLAMLIFYVQIIAVSQLVLALLMRTLQSRRFRDLSILLIALVSSSCYLLQQLVIRSLGGTNVIYGIQHLGVSPYLQWFPPGMAARAIQQASIGHWGAGFVWLAALLVVSVLLLYLWQVVIERGLTSDVSGGTARTRQRRVRVTTATTINTAAQAMDKSVLPPQMLAIALKDVKYFRRDPQLQATLLQSVMSIIVLLVVTIFNVGGTRHATFISAWSVFFVPPLVLLSLYSLSYNILGMERQSLTALFLFPIEPKYILWGKNLIAFVFGAVEMSILIMLAALVAHSWTTVLPALAIGFAGIGVLLGCGNFTSVFFPQKMRQMRRGFQAASNLSSEAGCLRAIMSLVALLVTLLVLVPVGAALLIPLLLHLQWIWTLSIPASLLYGGIFYYVVTLLVAKRMQGHVPEILAVVARE